MTLDISALLVSGTTLAIGGALLKIWRDTAMNKKTADQAAKDIAEHKKECSDRNEAAAAHNAAVTNKVDQMKEDLDTTQRTVLWIGDCVVGISNKMNIQTPQRPQ